MSALLAVMAGGFAPDDEPDAFTFTDVTGQTPSTAITSNSITVAGINVASAITVSGGTYSINGGGFTSSPGTVSKDDTVRVQVTTGSSFGTGYSATTTIGGVSDTFTATTATQSDQLTGSVTYTGHTSLSPNPALWPHIASGYSVIYDNNNSTFLGIGATLGSAFHWVRFQMASPKKCQSLKVRWYSGTGRILNFYFQGSNDGSSWTTLGSNTAGGYSAGVDYTITTSNHTPYSYYRLQWNLNSASGYDVGVTEFEMMGY